MYKVTILLQGRRIFPLSPGSNHIAQESNGPRFVLVYFNIFLERNMLNVVICFQKILEFWLRILLCSVVFNNFLGGMELVFLVVCLVILKFVPKIY